MKTSQSLKSSLVPVTIGILATITAFAFRQGEFTKTAHLTAPKDVLQLTSGGHALGFAKSGVYVATGSHALRVEFVNAHSTTPLSTTSPSETGNTKAAPPLSQVTYPNLWDGVTLTYDAPSGTISRSTYRLDPYANAENIRLRYNAPVSVQTDGSLRISFQTGTLNESAPQAWQEYSGKRVTVQIAFAARGKDQITFKTGHYDRSQPLFIDPTLTWNTFLGDGGEEAGSALAVDGSGNVYVTGMGGATWGSPVRAFSGGFSDAFVAKLDSSGNLIWNTFLGDGGTDDGQGVAVDAAGNIYVAGYSETTWGSPGRAFSGGGLDAFVAKLDSSGNLIWNTFIGGGAYDYARAVVIDLIGNIYLTGTSNGSWGSPVRAYTSGDDAFVAKLDSSGNLTWNSFLGGSGGDEGFGVAVDAAGNVYAGGSSYATWGTPISTFSGIRDPFVAKVDPNGNLIWNTFMGGGGPYDSASDVIVDGSGNVYASSFSSTTWGSPVRAFSGVRDAVVAKLDLNGNLIWNTFLGGSADDIGTKLVLDNGGNIYVTGYSEATWGSPDRAFSGGSWDAFAAQLDSGGNLIWNTFLGAGGDDEGNGLAVDANGNIYVAGRSNTTWGSPVRAFGGSFDAFVAKLSPSYVAQVQQPINADGSSVFNVKRGVVPVKFTLTLGGNPTCALPPATIALTRTAGGATGQIDESVYTGPADNGSNFRIVSCQYLYNLSASALGVGTYRVDTLINGTVVGSATFKLK